MLKTRSTDSTDDCNYKNRGDKFLGLSFNFWKVIVVLVFTSGVIFTTYKLKIEAIEAKQEAQACELKTQKEKTDGIDKAVAIVQSNIKELKDKFNSFDDRQQEMLKVIYAIKGQIGNGNR